ncbi:MAG: hypothetical protein LLG14_16895 [Nocardiaceae bacterium]|nr:hypothetical protein [Nocardiaceae bacterium]
MATDFQSEVDRIWGPMLSARGFVFVDAMNHVNEGGPVGTAVFYRNRECKLQVFLSEREGELGCKIAPLTAPDEYGPWNESGMWEFPEYLSGLPIDAGLAPMRPQDRSPGLAGRLQTILRLTDAHLSAAIAELLIENRTDD